jgi:hypothetical protein
MKKTLHFTILLKSYFERRRMLKLKSYTHFKQTKKTFLSETFSLARNLDFLTNRCVIAKWGAAG